MTDEVIDQPATESISDRIASKFGFPSQSKAEAATEATDATPDEGSDLADIDWDGLTFKAPAKIKEALMRHDDYTRKTQELADQRRGIDHVRELAQQKQLDSAFSDSVATEQQEIAVIDAYLQQASKLDWGQMSTDQIVRQKMELDNIKERRAALKSSVDEKRAAFNNEVNARLKELRSKSREFASKSIPGFSEDTEKSVRAYALSEGLTDNEVDNILLDPRSFNVVYKASQFDKVQKGTLKAADAATKADRVLKPGAADNRMPADVRAKLDFGKAMKSAKTSGDKARVIEDRLGGIFSKGR